MSERILSTVAVSILGVMVMSLIGFAQLGSEPQQDRLRVLDKMSIAVAPRGLTAPERCSVQPQEAANVDQAAMSQPLVEPVGQKDAQVSKVEGANTPLLPTRHVSYASDKIRCHYDARCGSGQCWQGFCHSTGYCLAYWTCA